jgi:hypothetical protein
MENWGSLSGRVLTPERCVERTLRRLLLTLKPGRVRFTHLSLQIHRMIESGWIRGLIIFVFALH